MIIISLGLEKYVAMNKDAQLNKLDRDCFFFILLLIKNK